LEKSKRGRIGDSKRGARRQDSKHTEQLPVSLTQRVEKEEQPRESLTDIAPEASDL